MKEEETVSILMITRSTTEGKIFKKMFVNENFFPLLFAYHAAEARKKMKEFSCDIVIIDKPLDSDWGTQLVIDCVTTYQKSSCCMIVRDEQYNQVSFLAEKYGISVLTESLSKTMLLQTIFVLAAFQKKIRNLERKVDLLREKADEIRLIDRAKLLLISQLKMSEQEAHRFIEKSAMDRCVKRKNIAESIIRTYEI